MTPERYQQVNQLLDEVLELSPEERAAYLSNACAGDEELRREVESLLQAHEQAQSFIEAPAGAEAAALLNERQGGEMIGRTLGHYQLRSLLGSGGMGEVYRATDTRLDREVAVKILPAHLEQDAEALHRFEREAKAVAALSHPNVCGIHDFGIEQGVTYAVMELLEGETLRAHLSRSALPWREASEIGAAVADGLAAAHAKGIIHRDLKPENIFLTAGGQVKVLDFGIARVKHRASTEVETGAPTMTETTRPGTMIGTVGYMSPEQVRGETAEASSDIFSLGCVLYEMVSGRRPFARGNTMETLAAILKEEPPALTRGNKAIPKQVERVISHSLAKLSGERYGSAAEMAGDLRSLLAPSKAPLLAPAVSQPRLRLALGVGAAFVVLLLGIFAWWFLASRRGLVIDSLAVLPLVNASGDAEMEYLSDQITESVINSLSQLPQLRVMARSTVSSYKGKEVDPRKVGQDLNVRAVLIGRMTQKGEAIIIGAELVKVADGSQLWGGELHQKLANISALQGEIAQQISGKLHLNLTEEQQKRMTRRYTGNAEAYRLCLKGYYYSNRTTIDGLKKGIQLLNQAVELDPAYALAYAGLAYSYAAAANLYLSPHEAMPKARAAALQALQFDETLGEAHTWLAFVKAQYDWDWGEAEKEYRRALQLNPGFAPAHQYYGWYLAGQGRLDEAIAAMTRARALDPLTPWISTNLAWFYYLARQNDEAISQLLKIIETDPNFTPARYTLSGAYVQKGMFVEAIAECQQAKLLDPERYAPLVALGGVFAASGQGGKARQMLDELLEKAKQHYVGPYGIAQIYARLEEKDLAFVWLEKAFQARSEDLLFLKVDPVFDHLHSDPRFQKLLRRLNLAP